MPLWKSAGVTHSGGGTNVTSYTQVIFGNVKGHKEWITYPDYNGVGNDYTVVLDGTSVPAGSNSDLVVSLWFNTGAGKYLEFHFRYLRGSLIFEIPTKSHMGVT